ELKQYEMATEFPENRYRAIRYFLGDVRDKDRLHRAFDGVDIIIHAAALKQVPACEYNPLEAVKTNILGASNVIDAAIDCGVRKVIAISTDKAVSPVNLYGATKLCSDKLFVAANKYSGFNATRFSVVRYGNVVGSRGSVIPRFLRCRETGVLPVTDPRMTRFWITIEQGVEFVLSCLQRMEGGEVFVPKLPSMNIMDLARAIAPQCRIDLIGIRPGEKLHEVLLPDEDARNTIEYDRLFVTYASEERRNANDPRLGSGGRWCDETFRYSSDKNDHWLTVDELRAMLVQFEAPHEP
ncbi:MAG: UDP-N-acetylglucosamine 4,6-dehydratase (inverting), partial [Rhodocyclaceae bacterium]|nr:UDP-N-acetylglucosamine 4,6-dehydratase (inverting) [Rhodocyclaceae bacterium]